jgi:hypothetical protein
MIDLAHQMPKPPHLTERLAGDDADTTLLVRLGVGGSSLPGGGRAGGKEGFAGDDLSERFSPHS